MNLYSSCVKTCPSGQAGVQPFNYSKTHKIDAIRIVKFIITAHGFYSKIIV